MKRIFFTTAILTLFIFVVGLVGAQQSEQAQCGIEQYEEIATTLEDFAVQLREVDEPDEVLQEMQAQVTTGSV